MNLLWTNEAWEDYLYWQKYDQGVLVRITGEHRLVYRVIGIGTSQQIEISQCRYHY